MEKTLREVEPGMVPCIDVCDLTGRVLVPAGTALNAKQIKLLKAWGIRNIDIAHDLSDELPSQDLQYWEQEVRSRIDIADLHHPLVLKLIPVLAQELAKSSG